MFPEPRATYRLQIQPAFGFTQAAELVPYLAELGISHLYASPYLQAATGSTHGYDVVDPSQLNQELGGRAAHDHLCRSLSKAGLGQMIDIVPNHMAIAGQQNPWWWDVLENGPASSYAIFFDVDWEASEIRWPNKVLLPVLGDHYGRILEDGQLQLDYDQHAFILRYHEHSFPLDPSSLPIILGRAAKKCHSELLAFLAESYARLPRPTVTNRQALARRHRDKAILQELLTRLFSEEPLAFQAVLEELHKLNQDIDALDGFIDQQNYRLALWRTARSDLGYRRFFDIKDLAGLRIEDQEVFQATHALPISWVAQGRVQGLRIDHPDGLRNPAEYFQRLRAACPQAWIVAEKILEPGEQLPKSWPIAGTTGYDFLNLSLAVFIDPQGEEPLTALCADVTGEQTHFQSVVYACKRQILNELLASEVNRLTSLFVAICEHHRRHRDYSRDELREALCETAVYFPVYRSYVVAEQQQVSPEDTHTIGSAIAAARTHRSDLDAELFSFLEQLLSLQITGPLEGELAMRFQQLTGPVMAKGVEDTTFYRFHRLIALNEVGGDPSQFGISPTRFHTVCEQAARSRPHSLLASTTHDTKRSEDVRARLALLSEIPAEWGRTVRRWYINNAALKPAALTDRNIEYLLYQTLVGAWPIDVARLCAYLEKAMREAKVHTSWTSQEPGYECAVLNFARALLQHKPFITELEAFVARLVRPGYINSLSQTLIKLTAPGIPDIYQGTELWDFSLVDPDNRRPVDFAHRQTLLRKTRSLSAQTVLNHMDEGLPKLWLLAKTLQFRREQPQYFAPGSPYQAQTARGEKAKHVLSFLRGQRALTVVPRLIMGLHNTHWGKTSLVLDGSWRNVLSNTLYPVGPILLQDLLAEFPVALLHKED